MAGGVGIPVPLSGRPSEGVVGSLLAMVSVAFDGTTAVGVNLTVTGSEPPGAILLAPDGLALNGAGAEIEVILSVALPMFLIVRVWLPLWQTATEPKAKEFCETCILGLVGGGPPPGKLVKATLPIELMPLLALPSSVAVLPARLNSLTPWPRMSPAASRFAVRLREQPPLKPGLKLATEGLFGLVKSMKAILALFGELAATREPTMLTDEIEASEVLAVPSLLGAPLMSIRATWEPFWSPAAHIVPSRSTVSPPARPGSNSVFVGLFGFE